MRSGIKALLRRIRTWLIGDIDETHPNALSIADIRDGVGNRR